VSGIREATSGSSDWSILFLDDSSPDGTAEEIEGIARADQGIRLLRRPEKEGLGAAYLHGFREVLTSGKPDPVDRVFMMDADLSHQPQSLPELDAALESGYDMALGSRYMHGVSVLNWSILRLNLSYGANRYIRAFSGMPFTDCTSGFRALRTDLVRDLTGLRIRTSGYAFLVEMLYTLWRRGYRIGEVPIVFVERTRGKSKVSPGVFVESLLLPPRLGIRSLLHPASRRPSDR
jgi:dolichol-phosphate mannosyltransferase